MLVPTNDDSTTGRIKNSDCLLQEEDLTIGVEEIPNPNRSISEVGKDVSLMQSLRQMCGESLVTSRGLLDVVGGCPNNNGGGG